MTTVDISAVQRHQNTVLHELFREQAARTPDAVAVVDGSAELSYANLDERSDAIAGGLRSSGAAPDVVIAVLLDRSAAMVAALLGVVKAGAAYLPIETDTPPARVAELIRDAEAPVCLVEPHAAARLGAAVEAAGAQPLTIPECAGRTPPATPPQPVQPEHLCAVYYTSGSTGRPKGVACTHAGWVNRMRWMQRRHGLRPGETVLHKTTLTFDDAAVEVFWPLSVGGRVAVLPPGQHRDPRAVLAAAVEFRAVHLQFVPSMLTLVVDAVTDADRAGLTHLRSVLSSGEALHSELVRRFRARFDERVALDNTWGATEASIDSTCHPCGPDDAVGDRVVSLGLPICGTNVFAADERLAPQPAGADGELCIGGVGLARGYLNDPARTAAAFVPHPTRPGERAYRTGDRGRLRPDGSAEFLGRTDDQVKIRGVRLELGEVEAALRAHPAVTDAAAVAWQPTPGDKRLAGYVVWRPDVPAEIADLRAFLDDRLPHYAVPGSLVALDALPRLPSGKLDRRRLPPPDPESTRETEYMAPRTATEEALARIWATVLGLVRIGVHDNFFAAGGHSLLVVRITNRMREAFGVDVPLSVIFQRPTIASAGEWLTDAVLAEIEAMTEDDARRLVNGKEI